VRSPLWYLLQVWRKALGAFVGACNARQDLVDAVVSSGIAPAPAVVSYCVETGKDLGVGESARNACRSRDSDRADDDDDEEEDEDDAMGVGGGAKKSKEAVKEECRVAFVKGFTRANALLAEMKAAGKGEGDSAVVRLKSLRRELVAVGLVEGLLKAGDIGGDKGPEAVVAGYYAQ
jgi:hypothetical protein